MLNKRFVKESERNNKIAQAYYYEYYLDYKEIHGSEPAFTFDAVEYFTVDNREDGLTEVSFYNKNDEYLFSDLY